MPNRRSIIPMSRMPVDNVPMKMYTLFRQILFLYFDIILSQKPLP